MVSEEMIFLYIFFLFLTILVAMATTKTCNSHNFPVHDRGIFLKHFCTRFVKISAKNANLKFSPNKSKAQVNGNFNVVICGNYKNLNKIIKI